MASLFDDDIAGKAESSPIATVPGTIVTINTTAPLIVLALAGDTDYVHCFSMEFRETPSGHSSHPMHTAAFIATSGSIKLRAPHGMATVTVYGEEA